MRRCLFILLQSLIVWVAHNNPSCAQKTGDWTLNECIDYALKRNIQIRKNENSNRLSELNSDQAKAQRFPSVNAQVNQNFNWSRSSSANASGFSAVNGSTYSMNSGVTLFNYSRINNLIEQANLAIESGNYELETVKESISLSILNAYLQVLYAEEQVANSRKQIQASESQLNLAGERLALKVISEADYARSNHSLPVKG
jgi:outer membrane protein